MSGRPKEPTTVTVSLELTDADGRVIGFIPVQEVFLAQAYEMLGRLHAWGHGDDEQARALIRAVKAAHEASR